MSGTAAVTDGPSGTLSSSFDALVLTGAASVTGQGVVQTSGSRGGFDPYYYKRRNKRRSKDEDIQQFLAEVLGQFPGGDAPEEVVEQAETAKIAALEYNSLKDTAFDAEVAQLRARALAEINTFYSELRREVKRRKDSDEEEDNLLLLS